MSQRHVPVEAEHRVDTSRGFHEKASRLGSTGPGSSSPGNTVGAYELQNALLLVLALYASLALIDLPSQIGTVMELWGELVDFLASGF
jgi:hypothetical protein